MEAVALGENGLLSGIRPGSAYFDLSTNAPSMVREVHAAFAERGAAMLDAPVSGGPRGAASGKLAIWVGGDQAVFDRCKPVLDAIGDAARYVGPIGAGSVAKLVHNCVGYIITWHGRGFQHGRQGRRRSAGDLGSRARGGGRPARRFRGSGGSVP